jgi:hypothetical protein
LPFQGFNHCDHLSGILPIEWLEIETSDSRIAVPIPGEQQVTPEEGRIRELPKLIADEKDPEKVKVLTDELGRLLALARKPQSAGEKPRSS